MDRNNQIIQGGRPVTAVDAARANEYFEQFVNAATLKHILGYYRGIIENLHLKPNVFTQFYPKLRASLTSWRAKAVWKKFDARASHKCYHKGKAAANTRVLVIGGGPCGMRAAIEAQLLGAKVVVVEKRDRFSRNNVLHLWPFVIEDLRMLGAKKFFGKFCAGSIDHISIRQLQCILLKVALLLGVEVHTEVSFEKLIEPSATEKTGWRAEIKPANHPVSHYEFDVIIGADGKRNTLHGFSRKEFRGKLAIAITANFINKKTEAEARVEEISGVAFIFNQKFFKELQEETRIDLENIVYYKDDTHYFVMTAKKASLLEKGVIKQDLADTEKLLAPENVDREALQQYAIEAANFSTNYQMPDLEFAVNHYGQPDIAMFDFTSMYAAENASKVLERNGHRLLMILVGDSLLEPFWPTGSGCARGFLSSLDAAWAIRSWSLGTLTPLDVLAERESIYRLLAQTTPDNLNKDWKSYTLDPTTRYPNLNKTVVTPHQVVYLYDTDNASNIDKMKRSSIERQVDVPRKRRRGNVDNDVLISWLKDQLKEESDINITDIVSVFKQGKALCAIIHHYRPDLLDYNAVKDDDPVKNNQLAIDVLEKELGIPPVMTGQEITNTEDYLTMATYLTEVYNSFKGEIPHVKHPKLELPESTKMSDLSFKTIKTSNVLPPASVQPSRPSSRHKRHIEMPPSKPCSIDRKTRKRRTMEKVGASVEERQKCLEEIASNRSDRQSKRRQQRKLQTEQFLKSMQMLQANAKPDSQPFEDYAIFVYRQTAPKFEDRVKDLEKQFTYVPDHDNKALPSTGRAIGTDEDVAARIKSLEDKWKGPEHVEKKPKDLLRAIGKIETSDWNIKEIEKKIMENKMGKPSKAINKEKVPKWSKEQFAARQTKMEKKHLDRQESAEAKYADIDRTIKDLDQKLKEGTIRQLGTNKVATLTEKLVSQIPPESKPPEKPVSRPPVVLPIQGGSESCHFCGKRVYLMERLSAEGRFFHHGCFKCQYCHTQLRLGSYAFDRDGMYGFKFFCLHHFGMVGELEQPAAKVVRKPSQRLANEQRKSPEKKAISGISGVDLLDRVRTPERVEFANLSTGHISSDQDESLSQMDEDEWTDKNFGASCAEVADSDDDSSSLSDTDSDDEYAYDDALEEPATKEGTMKWAERLMNSYSRKKRDSDSNGYSSSDQSSYYDSSDDDESETATEGEEEIRARELRKQEVRVEPPVVQTDTGTDTEIISDETSSDSSSEVQNSATEISTDSEFAHDDPTPTRELPFIALNDIHVTKTRGSGRNYPKRIQVKSGYLQKPSKDKPSLELKLEPIVAPAPFVKKTAPVLLPRTEGYSLNRTQSTGGIAAKVSLELKKKYLLGEAASGSIQKSGSASTLDTKFKSFQSTISDCQKLLKPAPEISASMQTFCNKLNERKSPISSPQSSIIFGKDLLKEDDKENDQKVLDKPTFVPDIIENTEIPTPINEAGEQEPAFENESEGRPRSPAYETSIIVPQINWNKDNQSLSSDSLATSESDNEDAEKQFENIPRVEIHQPTEDVAGEMTMDSLCVNNYEPVNLNSEKALNESENIKSITSEKKTLNQPKSLPNLENMLPEIHNSLHVKCDTSDLDKNQDVMQMSSGLSTPESVIEQPTAAMTETELSDWARDDAVSDDFEDVYDPTELPSNLLANKKVQIAEISELEDPQTIEKKTLNDHLGTFNLDSIEFMDTETSSEEANIDSQEGYVLLKNDDDTYGETIAETRNVHLFKGDPKNTGYCFVTDNNDKIPIIISRPTNESIKQQSNDHEEDSLQIIDTGTTTEENTFSDSTVKNVTEIMIDKQKDIEDEVIIDNNNIQKQIEQETIETKKISMEQNKFIPKEDNNIEFDEHCQRLQSRVEFSNARDSIDIRKSRRKSKSELPQKPDLIQEEKTENSKEILLNLSPTPHTPDILYNKEIIKKERDVNQKLIQEMVMNKMKAENKSLERKKRNRLSTASLSPSPLSKSATIDITTKVSLESLNNKKSTGTTGSYNTTPDVILTTKNVALQNSKSMQIVSPQYSATKDQSNSVKKTQFDSIKNLNDSKTLIDQTPKAPPRLHRQNDDIYRKLSKLEKSILSKQNNMKSSEQQTIKKTPEKRHSWLYSNDTMKKKKTASFVRSTSEESHITQPKLTLTLNEQDGQTPFRTKSIPDVKSEFKSKEIDYKEKICKSDPNMLDIDSKPHNKKKSKDRERRKSITKLFTTLFTKKSPTSNGSKGLFSKLSPKSKDFSKEFIAEKLLRRNSFSELSTNKTPPPIPPLPLNYTVKGTDESSEDDRDSKKNSSCETLNKLGTLELSTSSAGRRSGKAHKMARQAQLKRHRMAQEIQRKLEETEVKTKELERMGVLVEKSLRGEDGGESSRDESELLQEWFDLMRDRTELRRYEKELLVRAQELELEDRYARLQNELRERLENNESKTDSELKREEEILNEMMEIVSERDSLVKVIEEDRLRYCSEDRDLEEQMLAKGLRLTSIKKSPQK